MEFDVHTRVVGGYPVVSLRGEVDLGTLPKLHDALARAIRDARGSCIVVDLDGVHALDDSGLGVLLGAAGRARTDGGDLVVACVGGALRERLERTGFDRAVRVVASVATVTFG